MMLPLHNYIFIQKLKEGGSNARLSCAKLSDHLYPLGHLLP